MSRVIRISSSTHERLKSLSTGFEHPYQVIDRLLDFYDRHHKIRGNSKKEGVVVKKVSPLQKDKKRQE